MKIILGLIGQVVGGGFICNGHNRVKGHVWGAGGTAITKIIPGLTGQVVGGDSYVMDTTE